MYECVCGILPWYPAPPVGSWKATRQSPHHILVHPTLGIAQLRNEGYGCWRNAASLPVLTLQQPVPTVLMAFGLSWLAPALGKTHSKDRLPKQEKYRGCYQLAQSGCELVSETKLQGAGQGCAGRAAGWSVPKAPTAVSPHAGHLPTFSEK